MNRNQKIALAVAVINLVLIMLFPPFDQYSIAGSKVPAFAGFGWFQTANQYNVINTSLLTLEAFVILINAGIALLLLRPKPLVVISRRKTSYQNAVLIFVAINLVVVLVFPPFESVFAMTNAAIPTFEGFYPIFNRQPNHTIVTTLLYLEVTFLLVNGGLLWLLFKEKRQMTAEEVAAAAAELVRSR